MRRGGGGLAARSFLGPLLPESLVQVLQGGGPAAFAAALSGDSDTPELIWTHRMRGQRLVPQVCAIQIWCPRCSPSKLGSPGVPHPNLSAQVSAFPMAPIGKAARGCAREPGSGFTPPPGLASNTRAQQCGTGNSVSSRRQPHQAQQLTDQTASLS